MILYCLDTKTIQSVTGKTYCELGKDMPAYTYLGMWAGPPDYSGTYDVDDYVTALIRTDGPTISLNGAWAQNIKEQAMYISFLGSRGGIKLQDGGDFVELLDKDGALLTINPSYRSEDMFLEEIRSFLQCVEKPEKTRASIDNVLLSQRVLDAIYRSAETGREVAL